MRTTEIRKGIYWVGAIDWDIRNFHGYLTQRGTSYNAYLIVDEKIVLVDTVKHNFSKELIHRIKDIIDPSQIDYVLSNHVELDHSGALDVIMESTPNAEIITSPKGEAGLRRHFKKDWNFKVVSSGDSINLGSRSLQFVQTPLVHWPDSMVAYLPEERILFSNDAFGQHIASADRFDSQVGWDVLAEEAAKYYANIVLPFAKPVQNALKNLSSLEIELICPSHGCIWESKVPEILAKYQKWSKNESDNKAVIIYDSMWYSTEKIANSLQQGLWEADIPVTMRHLKTNHISDIMKDVLEAKLVLLGSPTLNNGMLPTMGGFLTYLKGLKPKNRVGMAFGSFGWGGQSVSEMEEIIRNLGWELPFDSVNIKYIPDENEFQSMIELGKSLGEHIKQSD